MLRAREAFTVRLEAQVHAVRIEAREGWLQQLRAADRYSDARCLIRSGYRCSSQNDEDGILDEIFRRSAHRPARSWSSPSRWASRTTRSRCCSRGGAAPGSRTMAFGASLGALEDLRREKGYALVGCKLTGVNAFFVREDLVGDGFLAPYTAARHYEPPRYGPTGAGHPVRWARLEPVGPKP